jgi:hypothetical protein
MRLHPITSSHTSTESVTHRIHSLQGLVLDVGEGFRLDALLAREWCVRPQRLEGPRQAVVASCSGLCPLTA